MNGADQEHSLRRRFTALWESCSRSPSARSAADVWSVVWSAYAEAHRHYHGIGHILFCLEQFALVARQLRSPKAVELAIWFHDVIHQPGRSDNEVASAVLFRRYAEALDAELVDAVATMIADTTHRSAPQTQDGKYLVDIDLAGLGQPWTRFSRESESIRDEQLDVSPAAYASAQQAFLGSLIARPHLYRTRFFRERYEMSARDNIRRILKSLAA